MADRDPSPHVQIRVLGHIEVSVDDRPVVLGGAKQRAVLAMLGLEAGRPVSADRIIEGLWGETPPPSAGKMVQNYVWRLRRGGADILTRGRAYELHAEVDACRLERLVAEAVRATEAGRPGGAAREALALFRGEPLADVADEPFAAAEIRRLEELRLTAAELAIEADLAGGHNRLAEIDALLADHPLRERLHAQRMLALYRGGRQAEALDAFREARSTLVEQIGVEPTPELRRLHDAILRQDRALDPPPHAALPAALDATGAPPLVGREAELHELRALWRRGGVLVTLAGAAGMGKTRLAAELAGEAHREGATIGYLNGAEARLGPHPDLLVIDDGDGAPPPARPERGLVLVTGRDTAALAALAPDAALVLAPLGRRAIAAVAALYAPAGGDPPPVAELAQTSGGIPRRVHELAGAWARREATRRVDEAAGRAAATRTQARAVQEELAGSVAELQATRERTGARAAVRGPVCPYKGLAAFDRDDAGCFFGRERLVAELVARLAGAPLLAVVGPSGSGKSSAVRAGLLPALAEGMLPGSDGWAQQVIRPGLQPVRELLRARRRLEREWRGALVVDQFEELFTACRDEAERRAFASGLVSATRHRDTRAVVLVVRADFYGRCAAYPELAELMGANHVLVGPMRRDELARAIERPAVRSGLSVEPDLVSALLADVEGQPGALPLLSTALLELWRDRDGSLLRLSAYVHNGGVEGAVARLAENAYLQLDPARRAGARSLLLRLTDEDAGGAPVRRRLPLAEADPELVAHLAGRRLLTVDDETVEVAHEALLREWPRLRSWLEEDAQGRRLQRGLAAAAGAWQAGQGELYRGARLAAALEWAAGNDAELAPRERAFLAAGRRAATRAQRRLRAGLAGALALALIAVAAGALALHQRANARVQATTAAAQSLGAEALAQNDLASGLLLARQGVALRDSPRTRGNLLATLLKSPEAVGALSTMGVSAGPELSPDGRTLAIVDDAGDLQFFAAAVRRRIGPSLRLAGVFAASDGTLRFSADGRVLAVGGGDPVVVDARTRRVLARMLILDGDAADHLAFSPDRRVVLALLENSGSGRASLVRFDARTGAQVGGEKPVARVGTATLMVAPDGRVVTSRAGGPTVIRDSRTLRPLRRFAPGAAEGALAPDGRTVVLGSADGSVRFLDLDSGRLRTGSGRHTGAVLRLAFSADGLTAASAGQDDRVIAWDVARAAPRATLSGHASAVTGVALGARGDMLYSSDADGNTIAWDLAGPGRFGRPFAIGAARPTASALGGSLLAVGHQDGGVSVVDARTLRTLRTFSVPGGPVVALAFLPRGGPLVVGGDDGYLALYDARSGVRLQRLRGQYGPEVRISLSADGSRMATLSGQDSIALWTLRHDRVAGPPRRRYPTYVPSDLALSPDGRTLVIASPGSVELVDARTFAPRAPRRNGVQLLGLGPFTPDGRALVVTGYGGAMQLWSARTLRPATRVFGGHSTLLPPSGLTAALAAVSPDGRMLAAGGGGSVQLFDLRSQEPVGAPLPTLANRGALPAFSADGAYLFALTDAGVGYRWEVRSRSWEARACAVAGRTLTRAEWAEALPGRPYAPACAG